MKKEYKAIATVTDGEGESNYNGTAFADPHIEIMEDDIVKGYKAAGDEIVKAWNDFDSYLKRHPEVWQGGARSGGQGHRDGCTGAGDPFYHRGAGDGVCMHRG